jgi:hypothetical protein
MVWGVKTLPRGCLEINPRDPSGFMAWGADNTMEPRLRNIACKRETR